MVETESESIKERVETNASGWQAKLYKLLPHGEWKLLGVKRIYAEVAQASDNVEHAQDLGVKIIVDAFYGGEPSDRIVLRVDTEDVVQRQDKKIITIDDVHNDNAEYALSFATEDGASFIWDTIHNKRVAEILSSNSTLEDEPDNSPSSFTGAYGATSTYSTLNASSEGNNQEIDSGSFDPVTDDVGPPYDHTATTEISTSDLSSEHNEYTQFGFGLHENTSIDGSETSHAQDESSTTLPLPKADKGVLERLGTALEASVEPDTGSFFSLIHLRSNKDGLIARASSDEFLSALKATMQEAESTQAQDMLDLLHGIIKKLVFLNNIGLLEQLVSDEFFDCLLAGFEYDPNSSVAKQAEKQVRARALHVTGHPSTASSELSQETVVDKKEADRELETLARDPWPESDSGPGTPRPSTSCEDDVIATPVARARKSIPNSPKLTTPLPGRMRRGSFSHTLSPGLDMRSRVRPRHRYFVREQVAFKQVVPINKPELVERIHQTFRLQFLRDVLIPRPIGDPLHSTLTQMIHLNLSTIIATLRDDSADFWNTFFTVLRYPRSSMAKYARNTANLNKRRDKKAANVTTGIAQRDVSFDGSTPRTIGSINSVERAETPSRDDLSDFDVVHGSPRVVALPTARIVGRLPTPLSPPSPSYPMAIVPRHTNDVSSAAISESIATTSNTTTSKSVSTSHCHDEEATSNSYERQEIQATIADPNVTLNDDPNHRDDVSKSSPAPSYDPHDGMNFLCELFTAAKSVKLRDEVISTLMEHGAPFFDIFEGCLGDPSASVEEITSALEVLRSVVEVKPSACREFMLTEHAQKSRRPPSIDLAAYPEGKKKPRKGRQASSMSSFDAALRARQSIVTDETQSDKTSQSSSKINASDKGNVSESDTGSAISESAKMHVKVPPIGINRAAENAGYASDVSLGRRSRTHSQDSAALSEASTATVFRTQLPSFDPSADVRGLADFATIGDVGVAKGEHGCLVHMIPGRRWFTPWANANEQVVVMSDSKNVRSSTAAALESPVQKRRGRTDSETRSIASVDEQEDESMNEYSAEECGSVLLQKIIWRIVDDTDLGIQRLAAVIISLLLSRSTDVEFHESFSVMFYSHYMSWLMLPFVHPALPPLPALPNCEQLVHMATQFCSAGSNMPDTPSSASNLHASKSDTISTSLQNSGTSSGSSTTRPDTTHNCIQFPCLSLGLESTASKSSKQAIVGLLCILARVNSIRFKAYFQEHHTLARIARLFHYREKRLILAVVRLIRTVLGTEDKFYVLHVKTHRLLDPVMAVFAHNGIASYNLVNSVLIELLDFISSHSIKELAEYLLKHYRPLIAEIDYCDVLKNLENATESDHEYDTLHMPRTDSFSDENTSSSNSQSPNANIDTRRQLRDRFASLSNLGQVSGSNDTTTTFDVDTTTTFGDTATTFDDTSSKLISDLNSSETSTDEDIFAFDEEDKNDTLSNSFQLTTYNTTSTTPIISTTSSSIEVSNDPTLSSYFSSKRTEQENDSDDDDDDATSMAAADIFRLFPDAKRRKVNSQKSSRTASSLFNARSKGFGQNSLQSRLKNRSRIGFAQNLGQQSFPLLSKHDSSDTTTTTIKSSVDTTATNSSTDTTTTNSSTDTTTTNSSTDTTAATVHGSDGENVQNDVTVGSGTTKMNHTDENYGNMSTMTTTSLSSNLPTANVVNCASSSSSSSSS